MYSLTWFSSLLCDSLFYAPFLVSAFKWQKLSKEEWIVGKLDCFWTLLTASLALGNNFKLLLNYSGDLSIHLSRPRALHNFKQIMAQFQFLLSAYLQNIILGVDWEGWQSYWNTYFKHCNSEHWNGGKGFCQQ